MSRMSRTSTSSPPLPRPAVTRAVLILVPLTGVPVLYGRPHLTDRARRRPRPGLVRQRQRPAGPVRGAGDAYGRAGTARRAYELTGTAQHMCGRTGVLRPAYRPSGGPAPRTASYAVHRRTHVTAAHERAARRGGPRHLPGPGPAAAGPPGAAATPSPGAWPPASRPARQRRSLPRLSCPAPFSAAPGTNTPRTSHAGPARRTAAPAQGDLRPSPPLRPRRPLPGHLVPASHFSAQGVAPP